MKKMIVGGVAVLCISINFSGCSDFSLFSFNRRIEGSGVVVQEQRGLADFTEVILSEKGDLFIEVGDHEELIMEAEDNFQEYLIANVENGVLEILKAPDNITLVTDKPFLYHLTVTSLESLTVKNSGDVEITTVEGDSFSVRITGSGNVYIDSLNVESLSAELTSSGELVIGEGSVGFQEIYLSSSGEYQGSEVKSINTTVRCSSSGNAYTNVSDSLIVDLSSSGSVYYIGDPTIDILDISSTGRVIKAP